MRNRCYRQQGRLVLYSEMGRGTQELRRSEWHRMIGSYIPPHLRQISGITLRCWNDDIGMLGTQEVSDGKRGEYTFLQYVFKPLQHFPCSLGPLHDRTPAATPVLITYSHHKYKSERKREKQEGETHHALRSARAASTSASRRTRVSRSSSTEAARRSRAQFSSRSTSMAMRRSRRALNSAVARACTTSR